MLPQCTGFTACMMWCSTVQCVLYSTGVQCRIGLSHARVVQHKHLSLSLLSALCGPFLCSTHLRHVLKQHDGITRVERKRYVRFQYLSEHDIQDI